MERITVHSVLSNTLRDANRINSAQYVADFGCVRYLLLLHDAVQGLSNPGVKA